jgi:hypothetical protein
VSTLRFSRYELKLILKSIVSGFWMQIFDLKPAKQAKGKVSLGLNESEPQENGRINVG